MSNAKRKMVQETARDVMRHDIEGFIDQVISNLQLAREQYGETLYIELTTYSDDYYSNCYGCGIEVEATYHREETDKEMQKRLDRAKKARETAKANRAKTKAKKEEEERKELARLLEKYGGE